MQMTTGTPADKDKSTTTTAAAYRASDTPAKSGENQNPEDSSILALSLQLIRDQTTSQPHQRTAAMRSAGQIPTMRVHRTARSDEVADGGGSTWVIASDMRPLHAG